MPPASFNFYHIILLAILLGISLGAYHTAVGSRRLVLRFGGLAVAGSMGGVVGAYLLAHLVTLITRKTGLVSFDPGYTFWGLFVAMALIGLMGGGLLGILIARKDKIIPAERKADDLSTSPDPEKTRQESSISKKDCRESTKKADSFDPEPVEADQSPRDKEDNRETNQN